MKKYFGRLLGWILFLWVRVEVFPENNPTNALVPRKPTLYVLADRGLSDLLVLSGTCRRYQLPDPVETIPIKALSQYHSVYSVASRNPVIDWFQRRGKQSQMLAEFLQAAKEDADFELQLVPVSVFWGRPLARQKHWLQVLFADTWSLAGRTRRFFTLLIHGRNTRLIYSEAIDFGKLAVDLEYDATALHDFLVNLLGQQREATFGPQITSHKQLSLEVIDDPRVQQTIAELDGDTKKLKARARRYCREIFADCTQLTIEVMLRLLRAFWNRYYAGVDVYNADSLRQAALDHQLVYLPCHRSHVDYLLLSYVIYSENLAIPYIAAGNNLDIPIIGRILRGGGAFFIRRSFKDKPLYSAVMRAYIGRLVSMGMPLEYFIEGGRSRSGRMLKPKFGMLGMTLEAHILHAQKPLAFVPVYLGYEKLMEGKSYLGELYGAKKKRESTLGALGTIFRLKGHFGKVTVSFGEPIKIAGILEQNCSDWANRAGEIEQRPDWYQQSLVQLSERVMHGINRACVINPVNAVATILLATRRQSIDIDELISQAALQRRLIENVPTLASIRVAGEVDREQIERMYRQKLLHINRHELGDIVYLTPQDSVLMGYYRNNILHSLIIPALIACCFTNSQSSSRARLLQKVEFLYPFLQSELQLEWSGASLSGLIDECLQCMIDEELLFANSRGISRPPRSNREFVQLIRLAQVAQPILARYYMTFILLWQTSRAPLDDDELERRCYLLAQKITMLHGINSPDFFDRLLFRDFINTMLESGYLARNPQGQLIFTSARDYVSLDLRNLLSLEVRGSILALINH